MIQLTETNFIKNLSKYTIFSPGKPDANGPFFLCFGFSCWKRWSLCQLSVDKDSFDINRGFKKRGACFERLSSLVNGLMLTVLQGCFGMEYNKTGRQHIHLIFLFLRSKMTLRRATKLCGESNIASLELYMKLPYLRECICPLV